MSEGQRLRLLPRPTDARREELPAVHERLDETYLKFVGVAGLLPMWRALAAELAATTGAQS
jgi:hypothetical protein